MHAIIKGRGRHPRSGFLWFWRLALDFVPALPQVGGVHEPSVQQFVDDEVLQKREAKAKNDAMRPMDSLDMPE